MCIRDSIKRGYLSLVAGDLEGAKIIANDQLPEFAVVDLRLNQSNGLEAVSYTHLDVYKRQTFHLAPFKIRLNTFA